MVNTVFQNLNCIIRYLPIVGKLCQLVFQAEKIACFICNEFVKVHQAIKEYAYLVFY